MAQFEVRDEDGNTVQANTVTGETHHESANIFARLIDSGFEVFATEISFLRAPRTEPFARYRISE